MQETFNPFDEAVPSHRAAPPPRPETLFWGHVPFSVVFRGTSGPEGEDGQVVVQDAGGERELPLNLHVRNHSPSGFAWGYGGSGPAQLALSMCIELVGQGAALHVYQAVKDRLIAPLQARSWEIAAHEVLDVIADYRHQVECQTAH